ncbi:hypothetical protein M0811_00031 [Anaeramoeba ignava]|uniref:BTB domain-containing protein n=1 Tax=Anaeramoeba ignava TaxID=1746090 RepID=A0A9Q0LQI1_ANAIG|nr:hypothetical protein M0811_00031 [Anaeramoeba ignava]
MNFENFPFNFWVKLETENTPTKRFGHSSVYLKSLNTFFLFGGHDGIGQGGGGQGNILNDLYQLNFSKLPLKWEKIEPKKEKIPNIFRQSGVGYEKEKKLIFFGGTLEDNSIINTIYQYNSQKNSFKKLEIEDEIPCKRLRHSAILDSQNQMWIFGGADQDILNDTWVFSLSQKKWNRIKTVGNPPPRYGHSVTIYNHPFHHEKMFIMGGNINSFFRVYSNDLWELDLVTLTWTEIKIQDPFYLPHERAGHVSTFRPIQDDIFIQGGGDGKSSSLFDSYGYSIKKEKWKEIKTISTQLNIPRADHTFHFFDNSKAILYGGSSRPLGDVLGDITYIKFPNEYTYDFKWLLKSGFLSDLEVSCIGGSFKVHKLIIQSKCKNIQKFIMTCSSHSFQIMLIILHFIYTEIFSLDSLLKQKNILEDIPKIKSVSPTFDAQKSSTEFSSIYSQLMESQHKDLYDEEIMQELLVIAQELDIQSLIYLIKSILQKNQIKPENFLNFSNFTNVFHVHKIILAARSELYRGLFTNSCDESNQVSDMSSKSDETIRLVLQFIYSNKMENVNDPLILSELFDVQEYYQLSSNPNDLIDQSNLDLMDQSNLDLIDQSNLDDENQSNLN